MTLFGSQIVAVDDDEVGLLGLVVDPAADHVVAATDRYDVLLVDEPVREPGDQVIGVAAEFLEFAPDGVRSSPRTWSR